MSSIQQSADLQPRLGRAYGGAAEWWADALRAGGQFRFPVANTKAVLVVLRTSAGRDHVLGLLPLQVHRRIAWTVMLGAVRSLWPVVGTSLQGRLAEVGARWLRDLQVALEEHNGMDPVTTMHHQPSATV